MEAEAETKVVEARSNASRSTVTPSEVSPRGRLVGRYELLHRLGHGGMATVYLGRAVGTAGFEKLVAVKVIHPHLASEPDFVEMFLDEARIAAHIRHPNVVEILDLGREDDVFFMVMEYVEGDTLSSLLKELRRAGETLPLPVALQIIADACGGLAAAHDLVDARGKPYELVHRDVSPHNLLADIDGHVKVVDFGIMKAAGKRSTTLTGQLRGKLPYMSPEQARGHEIDRRTDLFALGAVLWELLTNERLLHGETEAEILARACDFELPDFAAAPRALPPEVVRILTRALAPDRGQRYADAHEMVRDVRAALRAGDEHEEPREALGKIMRRHFDARLEYARAAVRGRGIDRPNDRGRRSSMLELVDAAQAATAAQASRTPTAVVSRTGAAVAPVRDFPEVPTAVTSTPLAVPRASRSWMLLIALPLVGAAVGTAVVGYAQRSDERAPERIVVAEPESAPTNAAGTTAAEPSETVKWVFNTQPQGATVIIDGHRWEQVTPVTVEVPRGDEPIAVRLEREGYQPFVVAFAPNAPQNYLHEFHALPEPVATPATNTPIRFTARKTKAKAKPEATSADPPSTTPTAPESKAGDDGRTLAEMPDLTGTRPRPPGG